MFLVTTEDIFSSISSPHNPPPGLSVWAVATQNINRFQKSHFEYSSQTSPGREGLASTQRSGFEDAQSKGNDRACRHLHYFKPEFLCMHRAWRDRHQIGCYTFLCSSGCPHLQLQRALAKSPTAFFQTYSRNESQAPHVNTPLRTATTWRRSQRKFCVP